MASTNLLDPIPHPPKKPVVGNMLSIDATSPIQHLTQLAKELGPIYWLDMMGKPMVVVSGHDLIEELSDEKRFDKVVRGALRRVRAVGGDGLFTADTKEPNWGKAHNILLQPFGNRAMQSYHPSMVDIAEQLVQKWERLNADEEIDVVHDMTALTLDTIGLCGFDYRFNSFYRRDYHPFVEALVRSLISQAFIAPPISYFVFGAAALALALADRNAMQPLRVENEYSVGRGMPLATAGSKSRSTQADLRRDPEA